jgi:hypothetical protein
MSCFEINKNNVEGSIIDLTYKTEDCHGLLKTPYGASDLAMTDYTAS